MYGQPKCEQWFQEMSVKCEHWLKDECGQMYWLMHFKSDNIVHWVNIYQAHITFRQMDKSKDNILIKHAVDVNDVGFIIPLKRSVLAVPTGCLVTKRNFSQQNPYKETMH